jgi:lipid A ethanolaminephosphotransferase
MPFAPQYKLIALISLILSVLGNASFFKNVIATYPLTGINIVYVISTFFTLFLFIMFIFTLIASKYTTKPFLIFVLMVSAFTAYFMDTYHVIIDYSMIQNSLQTNLNESLDLFSIELLFYIGILGLIPSYIVYKTPLVYQSFKKEFFAKLKMMALLLGAILIILFSFSKFYTSFFREHKTLKYNANPSYWLFSIVNFAKKSLISGKIVLKPLG